MIKQDFIMRLIERAGRALARALGKQAEGADDEAMQSLEQAYSALLRVDRHMFEQLTTRTLIPLLGPPEVVRMLARACKLESELLDQKGKHELAARRRDRAVELYLEVGMGEDPVDQAALVDLHSEMKRHRTS